MRGKKGSPADARAVRWALAVGTERPLRDACAARTTKSREKDDTRMIAVARTGHPS